MTKISRQRLEFATEVFLGEMRRQAVSANPARPSPVGNLGSYPPEHRSALMSAIQKALSASDAVSDRIFEEWQAKRAAQNPSNT